MKRVISRLVFHVTIAWEILWCYLIPCRRWWDEIDEGVILGAIPSQRELARLQTIGVGGVVNMCQEYRLPDDVYGDLGLDVIHLPTVDRQPPSLEAIDRAVAFISQCREEGKKVYLHCRAGRGRAATVALCWLIQSKSLAPKRAYSLLESRRLQIDRDLERREVVQQFWIEYGGAVQEELATQETNRQEVEVPDWFDVDLIESLVRKRNRQRSLLSVFDYVVFIALECLVRPHGWSYLRPVSWEELEERIHSDCEQIQATDFVPETIVGIKSGGAFLANLVAHCLGVGDVAYVRVEYYSPFFGSTILAFLTRFSRRARLSIDSAPSVQGKHVLLVDDQIYTGRSLSVARDWLISSGAAAVKTYCVYATRGTADFSFRQGRMNYGPWGDDP